MRALLPSLLPTWELCPPVISPVISVRWDINVLYFYYGFISKYRTSKQRTSHFSRFNSSRMGPNHIVGGCDTMTGQAWITGTPLVQAWKEFRPLKYKGPWIRLRTFSKRRMEDCCQNGGKWILGSQTPSTILWKLREVCTKVCAKVWIWCWGVQEPLGPPMDCRVRISGLDHLKVLIPF